MQKTSTPRADAEDWPLNPPMVDFYDPHLPGQEIHSDEFERAWATAQREREE